MASRKKADTKSKTLVKVLKKTKLTKNKNSDLDSMMTSSESSTIDTASVKSLSTKRKISILVALLVIGVVLYLSRGFILAASVNGEFLYRPTVISELEKRFGKQELDSLITDKLIAQEAKKKNVSLSDEELNAEISKIGESVKAQGQDLNTLLSMQGMTQDDLRKQIGTQKLVEKILADKVNPTDQEISDYIKANKENLPKGKSEAEVKEIVSSQLKQQKLGTEFQAWLDETKKNASIKYYTNY